MLDRQGDVSRLPGSFRQQFKTGDIPLERRLNVYRNNIITSLSTVIVDSFPLLNKLVGEDFLRGMAREFIYQNPPQKGVLNHLGRGFDNFIANFKPAQSLPFLPDVARLEIAMNDAYYAPNNKALTFEELGNIPEDSLADVHLALSPHVTLIKSDFPLPEIKAMCDATEDDIKPDMEKGITLLVSRPDKKVNLREITDAEFDILSALQSGDTLGEAFEKTLTQHTDFNLEEFFAATIPHETFSKDLRM